MATTAGQVQPMMKACTATSLDSGSWNTIPIGSRPTIDPMTNRPVQWSDVPNYSVGVSEFSNDVIYFPQ